MALNNSTLTTLTPDINTITGQKITAFLDIDRIRANPVYQCLISGGRTSRGNGTLANGLNVLQGIYNPDAPFSISVGSEYSDTFEVPALDEANRVAAMGSNFTNNTQRILKSLRLTEQRWSGSTSPDFNIKMNIPIVRKGDASWSIIAYMLEATTPSLTDPQVRGQVQHADGSYQIFAPNGYRIIYNDAGSGGQDTPYGTYAVQLGVSPAKWFYMDKALITSMDVTLGGKKYYDGNPTTVDVFINFKFWRMPMYEDIINWFPLMGTDKRTF